jgi:LytS/YehU family sensor histidine kinase
VITDKRTNWWDRISCCMFVCGWMYRQVLHYAKLLNSMDAFLKKSSMMTNFLIFSICSKKLEVILQSFALSTMRVCSSCIQKLSFLFFDSMK